MNDKNILILSYSFPPCNKVGGRRWAKFGKHLARNNYNVFVICVNVPYKGNCPWEHDIKQFEENITRLPYIENRPFYQVNKAPETLKGKIKYRLSWYSEKLFKSPKQGLAGNISNKYKDILYESAKKIIVSKKIKTVIVSGAPFNWCSFALSLKKEFNSVNFILDLRDFWTGGEEYMKFNTTQQQHEDVEELACIKSADYVFTPADRIRIYLQSKYPIFESKIVTLPHAYDSDEILQGQKEFSSNTHEISFAYGGILYANMEEAILRLIDLLNALVKRGIKVKVELYTFNKTYSELFINGGLEKNVTYLSPVSATELFSRFQKIDYLLQLRAGEAMEQHFKSSKFYELIALRRPIIYFGPEGDVEKFIEDNELGFSGNNSIAELCDSIIKNKAEQKIPDLSFDVSSFEYKKVTSVLEKFL